MTKQSSISRPTLNLLSRLNAEANKSTKPTRDHTVSEVSQSHSHLHSNYIHNITIDHPLHLYVSLRKIARIRTIYITYANEAESRRQSILIS